MSRQADLSGICFGGAKPVKEPTESDGTPLERYARRGYVVGDGDDAKALDAAIALTASSWGPPFDSAPEDGLWWREGYDAACRAVEGAIVDALTEEVASE
jgi:hypothetical protein